MFSGTGRGSVVAFWEYAAFLSSSMIFILIGLRHTERDVLPVLWPAFIAILLSLAGRAIAVYPFCALFGGTRHAVQSAHQHVLFWGGFRGAWRWRSCSDARLDCRTRRHCHGDLAVVAFSIFVQTLVMILLLRRLGVIRPGD